MAIKKPILKHHAEVEPKDNKPDEVPVAKKSFKKAPPVEEEEEEPAPKANKKKSFADLFNATKPGRGIFPLGDWKMKVIGYELIGDIAEDGEAQGELKAKITFEGLEDEAEGKTISNISNLCDGDGDIGPGVPFLLGDLDILGYEKVELADLEQIFADIVAEEPQVIVKVKSNGQYTNAYLQGLAEGE